MYDTIQGFSEWCTTDNFAEALVKKDLSWSTYWINEHTGPYKFGTSSSEILSSGISPVPTEIIPCNVYFFKKSVLPHIRDNRPVSFN